MENITIQNIKKITPEDCQITGFEISVSSYDPEHCGFITVDNYGDFYEKCDHTFTFETKNYKNLEECFDDVLTVFKNLKGKNFQENFYSGASLQVNFGAPNDDEPEKIDYVENDVLANFSYTYEDIFSLENVNFPLNLKENSEMEKTNEIGIKGFGRDFYEKEDLENEENLISKLKYLVPDDYNYHTQQPYNNEFNKEIYLNGEVIGNFVLNFKFNEKFESVLKNA